MPQQIKGDSTFIHPFEDPYIISGQGTTGLEIFKQIPEVTSVVVPIGGGGLISGVSLALKHLKPDCKIYGVVWDGTPSHCQDFHEKTNPCACEKKTQPQISRSGLTDGIAVKKSQLLKTFGSRVSDITCVSEEEISKAIVQILKTEGRVVEGSGAASLAGVLKNKDKWDLGSHCCVVLSGGNIDTLVLVDVIKKYGTQDLLNRVNS